MTQGWMQPHGYQGYPPYDAGHQCIAQATGGVGDFSHAQQLRITQATEGGGISHAPHAEQLPIASATGGGGSRTEFRDESRKLWDDWQCGKRRPRNVPAKLYYPEKGRRKRSRQELTSRGDVSDNNSTFRSRWCPPMMSVPSNVDGGVGSTNEPVNEQSQCVIFVFIFVNNKNGKPQR